MPDGTRVVVVFVLPVSPWTDTPPLSRQMDELHRLARDLRAEGIELIALPPTAPWLDFLSRRHLADDWEELLRGEMRQWRWRGYWWGRDWPVPLEKLERYYRRHLPEFLIVIQRSLERRQISGIILLTSTGPRDEPLPSESLQAFEVLPRSVMIHLELNRPEPAEHSPLAGIRSFLYPLNRSELTAALRSLPYSSTERRDRFLEGASASAGRDRDLANVGSATPRAVKPDNVHLGVAAPRVLRPSDEFVARFAAYTDSSRKEVLRVLKAEAPLANLALGLGTCRWRRGTRVSVRLTSTQIQVSNPDQDFRWNGTWHLLRFDAKVAPDVRGDSIALQFDVAVEGLPVVNLRPEIVVDHGSRGVAFDQGQSLEEKPAPRSAFASYARADRRDVLGRVRSLQIFTGIDVFLDCLSMRPGEEWKPRVLNEIRAREIFWLFWSREAQKSNWVEWEWRTALSYRSLTGIQPHPLEPAELAPPPNELSSLRFGAMHEWYITHMRMPRALAVLRVLLRRLTWFRRAV